MQEQQPAPTVANSVRETPSTRKRTTAIVAGAILAVVLLCVGGFVAFGLLAGGLSFGGTSEIDAFDYMNADFKETVSVFDKRPGVRGYFVGGDRYYEISGNSQNNIYWDLRFFKDPSGKVAWMSGSIHSYEETDTAPANIRVAGIYPCEDYAEAISILVDEGWELSEDGYDSDIYTKEGYWLRLEGETVVSEFILRYMP